MTLDLDELERKAKAATPGPWKPRCDYQWDLQWLGNDKWHASVARPDAADLVDREICRFQVEENNDADKAQVAADIEHIAAANPSVLLALIERVRTAEQDARDLQTRINAGMSTLSGAEHVVLTRSEFDALTEACYTGPRLLPAPSDETEVLTGLNPVVRGDK